MSAYTGLQYTIPEEEYHALPGLSSTGAKKILRSPQHFQHYIQNPHETKPEFDTGALVHSKVLGVGVKHTVYPDGTGPEEFEYVDEKTGDTKTTNNVLGANGALSTNLSKMFAAEARSNGLVPMKRVQARVVNRIAESILAHDVARDLLEKGRPEVSIFATDPDTNVALRGRIDSLSQRIADVKTTAGEASESGFAKQFFRLGYEVQFGHYDHIYELITGERLPWAWIVAESEAPYTTGVFVLGDDEQKMGRDRARRARETYATCVESGRWPGYSTSTGSQVGIIRAPQFAIYEYIDEGLAA